MWILEYFEDVRSDLSVFHRIDDVESMDAIRFLRFAYRLAGYEGMVRAKLLAEVDDDEQPQSAPTTSPTARVEKTVWVDSDDVDVLRAQLRDELGDVIQ